MSGYWINSVEQTLDFVFQVSLRVEGLPVCRPVRRILLALGLDPDLGQLARASHQSFNFNSFRFKNKQIFYLNFLLGYLLFFYFQKIIGET
jgi:hypothetical protein